MSKTAEDILNEHFQRSVPENIPMWDSAINAAQEFAAQEVEEYKKRLREKMGALLETGGKGPVHPQFHNGVAESYKLIEAVK